MVKQLRRRHFQIWVALLIVIPAGIISATLVIPKQVKDKLLQPNSDNPLPIVLRSLNLDNYDINLRTNADTSALQLEWINKIPLTYPTLTIYQVHTKNDSLKSLPVESDLPDSLATIEKGVLIGRIESMGTYRFYLSKNKIKTGEQKKTIFHFILYDFIHKKNVGIIKLI